MRPIKIVFLLMFSISFSVMNSQINTDSLQMAIDSARQDSINNIIPNQTKFSIQSGNNIVQAGNAMAENILYLRPGIMYYHKSGVYAGASLTYMPTDTTKKPIDNYYLNIGYDIDLGKNFTAGIDYSFSHYFSDKQVASSAAHMIRPYISWDNNIATPTLTPMILLGTTKDYALQLDFTHIFIFKSIFTDKDKISIPISIGAIGGTSDYTTTYNTVSATGKGKGKGKPATTTTTTTASQIALTSIYAMATIKYKIKNISLSFNTSLYHSTDPNYTSSSSNTPVYKLTLAYYL
jgi:hypothetical protein